MTEGRNKTIDRYAEENEVQLLRLDPAETYDPAIVGIAERCGEHFLVYDMDAVIRQMMKHDGVDYETAAEWHEFNTSGAWLGAGTPAFVTSARGSA